MLAAMIGMPWYSVPEWRKRNSREMSTSEREVSVERLGRISTSLKSSLKSDSMRMSAFAGGMAPQLIPSLPRQPSGATFTTSSAVVRPAATFIAPETRSGFMPSLYACSRIRASSASCATSCRSAGVISMIS